MRRTRRRRSVDGSATGAPLPTRIDSTGLFAIADFWRPHALSAPARPRSGSLAWYAKEILRYIDLINRERAIAHPTYYTLETAVHYALHIGYLHGKAFVRLPLANTIQIGVRSRTEHRRIAKLPRGQTDEARALDRRIAEIAQRIIQRTTSSGADDEYSTRGLSKEIEKILGGPPPTANAIRARLIKLKIKIK